MVNSAPMQLGRWGFVEVSIVYVHSRGYGRDRYILTQQRTAVAARVQLCTLYPCIPDFPRNIKYIRTSEIAISTTEYTVECWFSNIRWTAAGQNQRGHEQQVNEQLKPMNITQALAYCPATTTAVWSENH